MSEKHPCREWRGEPARYAQVKYDGHYARVAWHEKHGWQFFSSHPTLLKMPDRIIEDMRYCPQEHVLLGELWVPGELASAVKTAIKDGRVMFTVFAVETMPEETELEALKFHVNNWELDFVPFERLEEGWHPSAVMTWAIVDEKGEGVVFKDGNLLNWRKHKIKQTADLEIIGTTMGQGKFAGLIGSLRCTWRDGTVACTAGGMDDNTRRAMTVADFRGKIAEIEYQYIGSGGRLRHPRFKRLRLDKEIADEMPGV